MAFMDSYIWCLWLKLLQEAYGGWSSAIIWMLVAHSAQREIRERHHYSVDCVVAIYMGILLWKMVGLFWPIKDSARHRRLNKLEKIQSRLVQAAKDSDMEGVKELLKDVELSSQATQESSSRALWLFSGATMVFALVVVLLAFTLTSDGWVRPTFWRPQVLHFCLRLSSIIIYSELEHILWCEIFLYGDSMPCLL